MSAKSTSVILYGFWGSSCSWRVRAALEFKKIDFEEISINTVEKGETYLQYKNSSNPMGFIPAVKIPAYAGDRVFW